MGRRVAPVSVVLLLAALTLWPARVDAQAPPPRIPPGPLQTFPPATTTPTTEPGTEPTRPVTEPPKPVEPPVPEPLTPTILAEPPGEAVPPVPVIPSAAPDVEGAPPPPTLSSAPLRLLPTITTAPGGARPLFRFQPSISVSEEYTDNFDLTKNNKNSNFRTAIAPTMLLTLDEVSTKGVVAYTFTANHDTVHGGDNLFFHTVLGRFSWQATPRLRFTLADVFVHNDQPAEADALGLRRQRGTFTTNELSAAADYTIDRVDTRGYYRWNTFSDSGGGDKTTTQIAGVTAGIPIYLQSLLTLGYEYVNSHTKSTSNGTTSTSNEVLNQDVSGHQLTLSLGRKINPDLTTGLTGSYAWRDVSGGDATGASNFQIWTGAVYGTYGTRPFTITGRIGVNGITADSGESRGPSLSLSSTATYAWTRALVSLTVEHGFSETFTTGENFGVVETTGANAAFSYSFTPRTSATVTGYYRKTETTGIGGGQNIAGGPNINGTRNDVSEGVGATATLSVGLLRWLRMNLSYIYTNHFDTGASGTATDNTTGAYVENRVRLSFDMTF
jgi:hypothetical protein